MFTYIIDQANAVQTWRKILSGSQEGSTDSIPPLVGLRTVHAVQIDSPLVRTGVDMS